MHALITVAISAQALSCWKRSADYSMSRSSELVNWEVGLDGQPVRSETCAKRLLHQLGMDVRPCNTFGRNDCLIDSILLSLQASGHIIASLDMQQRNMTCVQIRDRLREDRLTSVSMDDYLSHEEHVECAFRFLLMECPHLWVDIVRARQLQFTIVTYDRFHCRNLVDAVGHASYELPESNPVTIQPQYPRDDFVVDEVPLLLYCNTHLDGTGYHYEWIRCNLSQTETAQKSTGDHPNSSLPRPQACKRHGASPEEHCLECQQYVDAMDCYGKALKDFSASACASSAASSTRNAPVNTTTSLSALLGCQPKCSQSI